MEARLLGTLYPEVKGLMVTEICLQKSNQSILRAIKDYFTALEASSVFGPTFPKRGRKGSMITKSGNNNALTEICVLRKTENFILCKIQ